MRTKLRGRISLLFMAFALMLAVPAMALAAELVTAELAGAQNKVTVEQGKSANFNIDLKAEGAMSCEITKDNPSKAKVINSFSITKTSATNSDSTKRVLPGANYSAEQNFWNDGSDCSKNKNSPVTWTGASNGYSVPASISVASDVPVGTYTMNLSSDNATSQITNPTIENGAKLEDTKVTTLTFEVVAPPPPPSDTTAPVITPNIQGTLGENGWYTSDVTLSWTAVDNESTISSKSGCDNVSITSDQNATTYKCTATSGGGTSSQEVSIKRDATAPVISGANVNNTTWRNSDLSESFTVSDARSGLASSADASFTLTASAESGSASTPTTVSKTVKDTAGNSSTRTLSALIDKTAPVISGQNINDTTWRNTNLVETFTASDSGGSGLANSADASFTLTASGESPNANTAVSDSRTVKDVAGNSATRSISALIDKTAPVIQKGATTPGTPNGQNGWYVSNVTNAFSASDSLSGLLDEGQATFSQQNNAEGEGVMIASGAVADKAGNLNTGIQAGPFNIDTQAPTIKASLNKQATASGWFNATTGAPTVSFQCSDATPGSGLAGACPASHTFGNGANQNHSGAISDVAGNRASDGVVGINVDLDAPSITNLGPTSQPNANGWYKGAVTNEFRASDGLSGFSGNTDPYILSQSTGAQQGIGVKVSSGPVSDVAGNTTPSVDSIGFNIDMSAPTLTPSVTPNPVFLKGTATADPGAKDALSDIASASCGPVDTSTVGTGKSVSCSATDKAGNSANASASYSVFYDFTGFFRPVDNKDANGNYVLNVAKAGSTIPVKFSLAGDQGLNIFFTGSPSSGAIACDAAATQDTIEETSTSTVSGLKYDSLTGQYVYNWKTDSTFAGKCRQLVVKLNDGTTIQRANFRFTK